MLSVLKRHAIQVLVAAGHLNVEVARFVGVDERTCVEWRRRHP